MRRPRAPRSRRRTGFGSTTTRSGAGSGRPTLGSRLATSGASGSGRSGSPVPSDSSAIELAGVTVRGRKRDVIVLTTTYGRTLAIDPGSGRRLWEFTPADIRSYLGSAQFTTATPIADPDRGVHLRRHARRTDPQAGARQRPRGPVGRLAGQRDRRSHAREDRVAAEHQRGIADRCDGRLHRRHRRPTRAMWSRSASRPDGSRAVWNTLCSDRHTLIDPAEIVPRQRLRDLGARRTGDRAGHRPDPGRHRQCPVQRLDLLGRQRARAQPRRQHAPPQLDAGAIKRA